MKVQYLPVPFLEVKATLPPKPRLTALGYTKQGGSPTPYKVRIQGKGENIWRRVYLIQFSNSGSLFVKVKGKRYFLRPDNTYQLETTEIPHFKGGR
jgi:hypothetical protein